MLLVPKLDNTDYTELFERVRSQIPMYTEEWTDFNHHDPGITTLSVFSWLCDNLHYYMDASGEEHKLKYLKLLGITPQKSAASCYIAMQSKQPINLGRGAKMFAGKTVFELVDGFSGTPNSLKVLARQTDDEFFDLLPFAGVDDTFAQGFIPNDSQAQVLYMGFENVLSGSFKMYFDIQEHPKRCPFAPNQEGLSTLIWECFDGTKWQNVATKDDETKGFLQSGFIEFALNASSEKLVDKQLAPAHYLRAKLLQNEYEVAPMIGSVYACCAKAEQTNTIVQLESFIYKGENKLTLDNCYYLNQHIAVYVRTEAGFVEWYSSSQAESGTCTISQGKHTWQKTIEFNKKRFGVMPEIGAEVLIASIDEENAEDLYLGIAEGYANERISFEGEHVYDLKIAVATDTDKGVAFDVWHLCDDITSASPYDKAFSYSQQTRQLVFGDAIHGMQLPTGSVLLLLEYKTSSLDKGQVIAHQVKKLHPIFENIKITNPKATTGGSRGKTSQELELMLQDEIFKLRRAVTVEDYEQLILNASGLMIDKVKVVALKEWHSYYKTDATRANVILCVKPYSQTDPCPILSTSYKSQLEKYLEPFRLLTVQLEIEGAVYAPIEVASKITLLQDTPLMRSLVSDTITKFVDHNLNNSFGQPIILGKLFSILETLPCVEKVHSLSLNCIANATKSNEGDIVLAPNALSYVRNIQTDYS